MILSVLPSLPAISISNLSPSFASFGIFIFIDVFTPSGLKPLSLLVRMPSLSPSFANCTCGDLIGATMSLEISLTLEALGVPVVPSMIVVLSLFMLGSLEFVGSVIVILPFSIGMISVPPSSVALSPSGAIVYVFVTLVGVLAGSSTFIRILSPTTALFGI